MPPIDLVGFVETATTRRHVLKTGVKLAADGGHVAIYAYACNGSPLSDSFDVWWTDPSLGAQYIEATFFSHLTSNPTGGCPGAVGVCFTVEQIA
jgi:hypothetical protein